MVAIPMPRPAQVDAADSDDDDTDAEVPFWQYHWENIWLRESPRTSWILKDRVC
jgi:hypothetical protein